MKHVLAVCGLVMGLSACASIPEPTPVPGPVSSPVSSPVSNPAPAAPSASTGQPAQNGSAASSRGFENSSALGEAVEERPYSEPSPNGASDSSTAAPYAPTGRSNTSEAPPILDVYPAPPAASPVNSYASAVATLNGWRESDVTPALASFQRSCKIWAGKSQEEPLHSELWEYGSFSDWAQSCAAAEQTNLDFGSAHDFFERYFTPVRLSARETSAEEGDDHTGLLTGYYQPEIEVRRRADIYFNEPILALPKDEAARGLERSQINAATSRVIGYGRPLDVFFMQVQGSGHLRYENGAKIRAAYAGNNGYPYSSIGRVLIERGELTKERSSKADIERWMAENGPAKARELMNQNKRYIFFAEEKINIGEGPKGAMRVPLTAMGSMAVDPRYYPYGALVWLNVKLPQHAGDYRGTQQGVLLSAQDTGKAIRGAMRGDLYFGSGQAAGELAGVMKHRAAWSILLPNALAARLSTQGIS